MFSKRFAGMKFFTVEMIASCPWVGYPVITCVVLFIYSAWYIIFLNFYETRWMHLGSSQGILWTRSADMVLRFAIEALNTSFLKRNFGDEKLWNYNFGGLVLGCVETILLQRFIKVLQLFLDFFYKMRSFLHRFKLKFFAKCVNRIVWPNLVDVSQI